MMISTAPVGPELDRDVWRCMFGEEAHPDWSQRAFSTEPADTMELIEYIAISTSITINYVLRGDDRNWYRVELVGVKPDDGYWEANGEGATLAEAVCRAATHMQDDDEEG